MVQLTSTGFEEGCICWNHSTLRRVITLQCSYSVPECGTTIFRQIFICVLGQSSSSSIWVILGGRALAVVLKLIRGTHTGRLEQRSMIEFVISRGQRIMYIKSHFQLQLINYDTRQNQRVIKSARSVLVDVVLGHLMGLTWYLSIRVERNFRRLIQELGIHFLFY